MNTSIFERLHSEAELNQEQITKNEQIKAAQELEGCTHSVRTHFGLLRSVLFADLCLLV
jgi:hypothetical protein